MSAHRPIDVLRLFTDARSLGPFTIGTISLAVTANAIYDLSGHLLGTDTQGLLRIIATWIAILLIAGAALYLRLRVLASSQPVVFSKPKPAKRRGLIFLLSRREPLEKAVEYHGASLSHCWLICSQDTLHIASDFKRARPDLHVMPIVVNDPFAWEETKQHVDEIYEHLPEGFRSEDVITDVTGLPTPATMGAILACLPPGRPLEYITAVFRDDGGKIVPVAPGDPIEITIDYAGESS